MVADNDGDPIDDEWIEDTLQHVYLFSTAVNSGTIDAEASKGDVTLAGTVDSALEREVAIQLAHDLRGVQRVDTSDQIGRASVRERVCQYGEIWVDGGT